MKKTQLASAISSILAASALCATAPVLAQDADAVADDEAIEEVTVTGSRIKKDVFTSSTPMDIIDVDEASIQGIANVGELLQTSTVAMGSPQVNSAITFDQGANGGLGTSTISLRGLGANRTLVLLNGRRAGPSGVKGATSSFDLGVLPLAAIERVEVLKDGASSIYGSDAVAGVVNIITKKSDGASFDVFLSAPGDSGGEESRISASWGKSFNRGSFRVTADYNKKEQLRRGDRDYFNCGNQFVFDPDTGERADAIDPRTGEFHCDDLTWGHVWVYDYGGANPSNIPGGRFVTLFQYDYEGDNLGDHIPAQPVDPSNPDSLVSPNNGFFAVGYDALSDSIRNDDHPFQDAQTMIPSTELTTLYMEADYQLTDNITAYAEVLLNRRTTKANSYRQIWGYTYPSDSGTSGLPTNQTAGAGWTGAQWYSPTAITDHGNSSVEVDYQRFVAGLQGSLNDSWDWDLAFQYSHSEGKYTDDRVFDDSIRDQNWLGDGDTINGDGSVVGTLTSVRGVPNLDIPWLDPQFLAGVTTPALRDFLFGEETGVTEYDQWSIDGFVTGQAFELPAGPLGVAIGFHYREDEILDTPGLITFNPDRDANGDFLRDPITNDILGTSNSWLDDAAGITAGEDSTIAVFAEVDIPIFANKPMIENFTINASARYTDVDSFGDDTTWKVGVNWQIIPSLRLRANQGTSFRTPALFELFLANQTGSVAQNSDVCANFTQNFADGSISDNVFQNCSADPANLPVDYSGGSITPTVFVGGGAGFLKAETADSTSIGLVWQPGFADLSISADYFDVEVKDEVDQFGAVAIIAGCYESDFGFAFGDSEPLCDLFDRTGLLLAIDNVRDSFINIARQRNRGYDFEVRYRRDTPIGDLRVDLSAALQVEDTKAVFEETAKDFNGLIGDPEWVGTSRITLVRNDWSYFWGLNYVGPSSQLREIGSSTVTRRGVTYDARIDTKPIIYHSFSVRRSMANGLDVLLGVANAFDQEPPKLTSTSDFSAISSSNYSRSGNSVVASQYDFLGRRFFLNLTMNFQ